MNLRSISRPGTLLFFATGLIMAFALSLDDFNLVDAKT